MSASSTRSIPDDLRLASEAIGVDGFSAKTYEEYAREHGLAPLDEVRQRYEGSFQLARIAADLPQRGEKLQFERSDALPYVEAALQEYGQRGCLALADYQQFRSEHPDAPSFPILRRIFGSWTKATEAAGGAPARYTRRDYDSPTAREEMLNELRDTAEELGHVPNVREYRLHRPARAADPSQLALAFGTYKKAVAAAGLATR